MSFVDWDGALLAPIYDTLSVTATLTPFNSTTPATVPVLDETKGVEIPGKTSLEISTVKPGACVRVSDLTAAGLQRSDLRKAAIAFNGKTYRVEDTHPRPMPSGESTGEILLVLTEH